MLLLKKRNAAFLLAALALTTARAHGEDVIFYAPTDRGNVMDWLVSQGHQFPYDFVGSALQFSDLNLKDGEGSVQPQAGMKAGAGLPWDERHYEERGWTKGAFDFKPQPFALTYAFVYLYCDQEQKDVTLFTGSDDGLLALLNGTEVQRIQVQRGYAPDQEKIVVTLKQGWNSLLCKVDDISGGHGLFVRFADSAGQPLKAIKVCLVKPSNSAAKLNFVDGKIYEHDALAALAEAGGLSAEGKLLDAVAKFEDVVAKYPKSATAAEALYRLAAVQAQQNQRPQALSSLDRAMHDYPYSKWCPDVLLAKAENLDASNQSAEASAALKMLIEDYADSALRPEAMLRIAQFDRKTGDIVNANHILEQLRTDFPATVESVKALDALADLRADGDLNGAKAMWQQVIDQANELSNTKYVWYVNVQSILRSISDGARQKIETAH